MHPPLHVVTRCNHAASQYEGTKASQYTTGYSMALLMCLFEGKIPVICDKVQRIPASSKSSELTALSICDSTLVISCSSSSLLLLIGPGCDPVLLLLSDGNNKLFPKYNEFCNTQINKVWMCV